MRLVAIGFAYGEAEVRTKKEERGKNRIPETGMRKDLRALQNFKAGHEDQFCAEQAGAVISICDTEGAYS